MGKADDHSGYHSLPAFQGGSWRDSGQGWVGKSVGPALFLLPFRWPRPVSFFPSWGLGRGRGTWERCHGAALELLTEWVGDRKDHQVLQINAAAERQGQEPCRERGGGQPSEQGWRWRIGGGVYDSQTGPLCTL